MATVRRSVDGAVTAPTCKTRIRHREPSSPARGRAATGGNNAIRSVAKGGAKIRRKDFNQDALLQEAAVNLFGTGGGISDAFADVFDRPFSVEPNVATKELLPNAGPNAAMSRATIAPTTSSSALLPTVPSAPRTATNAGARIVAKAKAKVAGQSTAKSARVNHAGELQEFGCIMITEQHIMMTLMDQIRHGKYPTYTLFPPPGVERTRWNKSLINIVDINIKLKTITYTIPENGSHRLTLGLGDFNRIKEYGQARKFKRRGKRSILRHPRSIDVDLLGIPNTLGAIPQGRQLARDKSSITPRDGVGAAWCEDPPTAFVAVGHKASAKEAKQCSNGRTRAAHKAARAATLTPEGVRLQMNDFTEQTEHLHKALFAAILEGDAATRKLLDDLQYDEEMMKICKATLGENGLLSVIEATGSDIASRVTRSRMGAANAKSKRMNMIRAVLQLAAGKSKFGMKHTKLIYALVGLANGRTAKSMESDPMSCGKTLLSAALKQLTANDRHILGKKSCMLVFDNVNVTTRNRQPILGAKATKMANDTSARITQYSDVQGVGDKASRMMREHALSELDNDFYLNEHPITAPAPAKLGSVLPTPPSVELSVPVEHPLFSLYTSAYAAAACAAASPVPTAETASPMEVDVPASENDGGASVDGGDVDDDRADDVGRDDAAADENVRWVFCEECHEWREVPRTVLQDDLDNHEKWSCDDATWLPLPDIASCATALEVWSHAAAAARDAPPPAPVVVTASDAGEAVVAVPASDAGEVTVAMRALTDRDVVQARVLGQLIWNGLRPFLRRIRGTPDWLLVLGVSRTAREDFKSIGKAWSGCDHDLLGNHRAQLIGVRKALRPNGRPIAPLRENVIEQEESTHDGLMLFFAEFFDWIMPDLTDAGQQGWHHSMITGDGLSLVRMEEVYVKLLEVSASNDADVRYNCFSGLQTLCFPWFLVPA